MTSKILTARPAWFAAALAGTLLCLPQIALGAARNPGATADATSSHAAARLSGKQYRNVQVTVNNGIATLTGTVNLYEYKKDTGNKVAHTQGVTGVRNEIQVAGLTVSDAQLEKKLAPKLALSREGYGLVFDAVTLQIHDGVVILGGQCHDYPNRNADLALVESTPGVKDVIDHIVVDPPSPIDSRIRREAEAAIYGAPSLHVYAMNPEKPIRICVDNQHITLYGTVSSKSDKQIAYMRARQIPGVFSVKDNIQVAGQPSGNGGPG